MSHELARQFQLRRDLEFSHQQQQGKAVLVVKDPVTRRYFRFTKAQADIMECFTGAPGTAADIAVLATEKLNATVSVTTIEAFCQSLEERSLLETPEIREKLGAIQGQQLEARNFLYWKIASINPEHIFAWLLPRTRWAFTTGFQFFALLAIFAGFAITFLNWSSLSGAAPGLFSLYGLLLIWPVIFTVTTIHEFSHGLTCCHYGGKVHEVGFMLIYFSPAFYCDVSDSYMFPKRTRRMAVALAGGYMQLTVWGISTIIWRLTDPDVFINKVALIVVVFSGLQTLMNFNPLIKLDGYYMLSDFLEVPNLRGKALRSFWDWIAGNGRSAWSFRERRAQLIYGALSAVFSISLLIYVYLRLLTWATSNYALAGLVVFGIFANFTLRKALVEPVEGVKAVVARASMRRYRNLAIILTVLILSFVLKWELKVSADFKIIPLNTSSVTAGTEGRVDEILVKQGSVVKKGQVVARLTTVYDLREKIEDVRGQLKQAKADLEDLRNGTQIELIREQEELVELKRVALANARNNKAQQASFEKILDSRKSDLENAQQSLDRAKELQKRGLIPRDDFEKAENGVKSAQQDVLVAEAYLRGFKENADNDAEQKAHDLAVAQRHLEFLKSGNRSGLIEQKAAEVGRLTNKLELQTREQKQMDILASSDGIVSTEFVERKKGRHLDFGEELMQLIDISSVKAEIMVPQKELGDVEKSGYEVRMKLDSYPAQVFAGKVDYIPPVAQAQTINGHTVVAVYSLLANSNGQLKPDLTGNAKIYCGKRPIIELMTRRVSMWLRMEFWDLKP